MAATGSPRRLKHGRLRQAAILLVRCIMVTLVRLPFPIQLRLGKSFGRLAYHLAASRRRVATRNIDLCMPNLTPAEREALVKRHFEAIGASIVETAMGWFGDAEALRRLVTINGQEHLAQALKQGRGVVLYSGHFTTMEITFPAMKPLCPRLTGMYKAQRNPTMTRIMNEGRLRSADEIIGSDNVRAIFRNLRRNAVVWYASDQCYAGKGSALIPFFGEPAMTNTAIWRIATATGAVVLPYFPRRLPDDSGYTATIGAPLPDFPTDDQNHDVRRLVELMEAHIRLCPDQYWWVHKRFKSRPAPLPRVYDTSAAARSSAADAEHG